jgi:WhiB family transcriptional regulator, redox-sensing transcriptional regulator
MTAQHQHQHRHLQEGTPVRPSSPVTHGLDPVAATTATAPAPLDLPCREHPGDLWFAESPGEVEQAKALCHDCPIRQSCLAGALQRREPWGVWGGQLVLAGVVVPRKRPRGRPRKSEVAA